MLKLPFRPIRAGGAPGLRVALGIATLAAIPALSSCAAASNGVDQETATVILKAASRALSSARTFEIHATSTVQGSTGSITFEIEGQNEGEGTFTSSAITFQAEELNGVDYFRSSTLWNQVGGTSLQAALGDRWVYISASSSTAAQLTEAFGELTSPKALADQLTKGSPDAVKGKKGTLGSQPVIVVNEPPTAAVYVASTGKPYPLRWVQTSSQHVDFSDFGKKFHLRAPSRPLNLAAILAG